MHSLPAARQTASKSETYDLLIEQAKSLIEGESDLIANLANLSALIWQVLPDLNWAGFYLWKGNELVVGPFQGKPACVRIALGKGVCGTAVAKKQTIVVPDVDQFPGHIVCDSASRSEIVVPMMRRGEILGVLDIDSPKLARFDAEDQKGLERLVAIIDGVE
ncbi:MAG TPA: GAF domain-containing protein [Nevskiaceae bacterium]|nr:GAF domain-containing protein [Nevskiaceae bacterium]